MQWKTYFKPWVLEQGRECFLEGAVSAIRLGEGTCSAVVSGKYEVEIALDEEEVYDMSCTCPYAEKGHSCKHMAAVLCALEERDGDGFVDSIPEDLLRKLVKEYCAIDSGFLDFLKKQGSSGPEDSLEAFEELLSGLTEENAGAFPGRLQELSAQADPDKRTVMVLRLSDWMEENKALGYAESVETAMFSAFGSEREAERLLEYVDGRLLDPDGRNLARYVREKLRLLGRLGIESRFVSPFRKEHLDVPEAMLDEAEYLIGEGEAEAAEHILEEGRQSLKPGSSEYERLKGLMALCQGGTLTIDPH